MMSHQFSELPKISGALNNCALNCALPTIFGKIDQISKLEIQATENLKLFKRLFKEWYNIEKLSWHTFNTFISSQNFADNEFIFAPILREFLRRKGAHESLVEVQNSGPDIGRYAGLESDSANRYFFQHFGIYLHENQAYGPPNNIRYFPLAEAPPDKTPIEAYLRNGHFELKEHENIVNSQQPNSNLEIIHELITSNSSQDSTHQAFDYLKVYVTDSLAQTPKPVISKTDLQGIVNAYQSDDYYLHLFLWVITLGFHKRASSSILMLQNLLQTES